MYFGCSSGGIYEKSLPQEDYFSRGLYTFDIGQNDLTAGYKLNMTTEQVKGYVPDVILEFSDAIKVMPLFEETRKHPLIIRHVPICTSINKMSIIIWYVLDII